MASTNKTTNLNLNTWVGSDKVKMADFNYDNSTIDTAVGANPTTALNTNAKTIVPAINEVNFYKVPTGAIMPFAGSTAPTNTLLCNGDSVPIASYPALYAIIGTTYGGGGANFNVPNLNGRVPVGVGTSTTDTRGETKTVTLGENSGEFKHVLLEGELASHYHVFDDGGGAGAKSLYSISGIPPSGLGLGQTGVDGNIENTQSTGSGSPHNNVQPYLGLNYIIMT